MVNVKNVITLKQTVPPLILIYIIKVTLKRTSPNKAMYFRMEVFKLPEAKVIRSIQVEWFEPPLHTKSLTKNLITPENTETANISLRLFRMDPGGSAEPHAHKKVEHIFYMINGQLLLTCNGKNYILNSGDAIHIPPGVQHSAKNTTNQPAILIVINIPPQD